MYDRTLIEGWWVWPEDSLIGFRCGVDRVVKSKVGQLVTYDTIFIVKDRVMCEPLLARLGERGPLLPAYHWWHLLLAEQVQLG